MNSKDLEEPPGPVPYAPEFTPSALGRKIGGNRVLPHLLQLVNRLGKKRELAQAIADDCLGHIKGSTPQKRRQNQLEMASHVIQALRNYLLIDVGADDVCLLPVGKRLLSAEDANRDRLFARHILLRCNGLKVINTIREFGLRGESPSLEALAEALEESRTSKSVSSMKAWLARAGVLAPGRRYEVNEERLEEVQGASIGLLYGFSDEEAAFLVAARVLNLGQGSDELVAREVADLAELRQPEIKIPRKPLGSMVKRFAVRQLLESLPKATGVGGTQARFKLAPDIQKLTEEELESALLQGKTGIPPAELWPLEKVYRELDSIDTYRSGRAGEVLAYHLVLMLGLRVQDWRKRAPHSEIDLVADRRAGLAYQRWFIQVKNTKGNVDVDRIDREVGAAAGTGATHLLFLAPRAGISGVAKEQILVKNRLTPLHVYSLDRQSLSEGEPPTRIIQELRAQEGRLTRIKRREAERRERRA